MSMLASMLPAIRRPKRISGFIMLRGNLRLSVFRVNAGSCAFFRSSASRRGEPEDAVREGGEGGLAGAAHAVEAGARRRGRGVLKCWGGVVPEPDVGDVPLQALAQLVKAVTGSSFRPAFCQRRLLHLRRKNTQRRRLSKRIVCSASCSVLALLIRRLIPSEKATSSESTSGYASRINAQNAIWSGTSMHCPCKSSSHGHASPRLLVVSGAVQAGTGLHGREVPEHLQRAFGNRRVLGKHRQVEVTIAVVGRQSAHAHGNGAQQAGIVREGATELLQVADNPQG